MYCSTDEKYLKTQIISHLLSWLSFTPPSFTRPINTGWEGPWPLSLQKANFNTSQDLKGGFRQMSPSVNTYVTLFSTGIQRPLDPKFSYILKLYLTVKRCQNAQTLISGMTVLACPSISCPITMSHPTQR